MRNGWREDENDAHEAGQLAGPGPMQLVSPGTRSLRKGCGTRDTHALWYSWDACGMVCSSIVWMVDVTCCYGIPVFVVFPTWGSGVVGWTLSAAYALLVVLGLTCHLKGEQPCRVWVDEEGDGGWAFRCVCTSSRTREHTHARLSCSHAEQPRRRAFQRSAVAVGGLGSALPPLQPVQASACAPLLHLQQVRVRTCCGCTREGLGRLRGFLPCACC